MESLIVGFPENILPSTTTSSQFPSIVILFIETYLFPLISMIIWMFDHLSFWKLLSFCDIVPPTSFLAFSQPQRACDFCCVKLTPFLASRCAIAILLFLKGNITLDCISLKRGTVCFCSLLQPQPTMHSFNHGRSSVINERMVFLATSQCLLSFYF